MRQIRFLLLISAPGPGRDLHRAQLARCGIAVAIATSLEEAIAVAESIVPWRLLVDSDLVARAPHLVRGLSECPFTRNVPIVLVDDGTSWAEIRRALNLLHAA